ncbi:bifunctional UDP-N-acetylglucosamine diphosphorylase/glucosamine-1-phosphate N-acetyltransferase GlmU [Thiohalobacter sp. IOR34]|uniref:bifunctional UDP-N-acetylglucosamine diphosphorylase/glucosamine-1-phosphate N-acetyltransferase GlmU n=1 Tax=Thiohalobacter sp. IOR34 TaxID=3057176 RepID=UPI0025B03461|nr:bifunctional UDP-N-acetylglucosamine diphosphorylase/glucosamine-1-phosphate N-acetyltransferase GlmU [Thiohalobacter sp. IOR34]WJW76863.1 bifunctional UDP-N-acetylglucosamine diphosphorylase/glucosamine-1-phosphate N-acetyltransferase GlmU [Thiohalobacter sp. IOR34]
MTLDIIILAAGQGTRMRSALPKVLHPLAGRPLLEHVLDTASALGAATVHVVHGHGGEQVRERLQGHAVQWVEQAEQLGTGHAVAQALPAIPDAHRVLVLYGDVPLISEAALRRLCAAAGDDALALLTARLDDPTGYGRILRDAEGRVLGIVEQKDATPEQRAIREINTGFLAVRAGLLKGWLAALDNSNAQGEYYLTDVVAMAEDQGVPVEAVATECIEEILGVNDRGQLATLERHYQRRQAERLMREGVTLLDPARFDLRGTLYAGQDVSIDVNAVFEGRVVLGDRVRIGPNCVLRDVEIGDDVVVQANCVLEDAVIGRASRIGPFARIRPETRLAEQVHIGNFVEVKKSEIGPGSKVNHLSYIGDSQIGARVNVGAGTITCNYDGANKHRTVIEDDAFIGSDSQLVAPVTVGAGATIGAGTTLTRDAPPGELTLSRAPQKTRSGWKRPEKKK